MSLRSFAFVRCAFANFLDVDIDDNFVFQDKLEIPTYVRSLPSIDMIASLIECHGVFLFKTPFIAKQYSQSLWNIPLSKKIYLVLNSE